MSTVSPGQRIQLERVASRYKGRFAEVWAAALAEAERVGLPKIVRVDDQNAVSAATMRNLADLTEMVEHWWDRHDTTGGSVVDG